MKKKIKIIFKEKENIQACEYIRDTIRGVFSDFADVEAIYLDTLQEDERIKGDVFLLNNMKNLDKLVKRATSVDNIFELRRSIEKQHVNRINDIPEGEKVLVVNDDAISSQQTVEMLYRLGFTGINMIAFDPDDKQNPEYEGIRYAITPEEPDRVPGSIDNVINIGYRKVAFDTMTQIKQALGIDNEDINLKLFEYASTTVEPVQNYRDSYVNSYLKSRILNDYIFGLPLAMIVFNHKNQVVYSNKMADEMFPVLKETKVVSIGEISRELELVSGNAESEPQILSIADVNCLVTKKDIKLEQLLVGYVLTIQNETNIKDMDTTLNRKLIEKGLFAKHKFADIAGESEILKNCIRIAKKAAETDYTILINGESGVGKELFAQSIHNYSSRADKPFVGVNCAAIPENLLESELFGYEAGAFTGASKGGKLGYFERANHGTIFLDEIGDISPGLQTKLLRVLQERQIMRVGSDRVIDIDVRIIAATNKDLNKAVISGNFRNDLYYRLNALQIRVPSLRERKSDIPLLFKKFMGNDYMAVGSTTLNKLVEYDWPGNIRELENCVLYYKTLGQLPEMFGGNAIREEQISIEEVSQKSETASRPVRMQTTVDPAEIMSDKDLNEVIKEQVLMILGANNALGHGFGRTAILTCLKSKGYKVSDGRLRVILSQLSEEGLLTIGQGRKGTKITDKGILKIQKRS